MPLSNKDYLSRENLSPFSRARALSSRENRSSFETSFRVYYGANGAAIPFMWESQPGTPKHPIFNKNDNIVPPLTPPPSYTLRTSGDPSVNGRKHMVFRRLFNTILQMTRSHVTPTSSPSSSSSISSSSARSTPRRKCNKSHKRSLSFCCPMEKFPLFDTDEKEPNSVEFSSSSMCFGFKKGQECYTRQDMKNIMHFS